MYVCMYVYVMYVMSKVCLYECTEGMYVMCTVHYAKNVIYDCLRNIFTGGG